MTSPTKEPSVLLVTFAFAVVYIVWGSTYFFMQVGVRSLPPFILGALRFTIAGMLMLGWSAIKKEKLWDGYAVKMSAITGLSLLFVATGIVIWVEQFLPSSIVAIVISSAPIWFVLLDWPKWGESLRNKATLLGLLTGFGGVMMLFWDKLQGPMPLTDHRVPFGFLLIIISCICWSGGSLYSKYHLTQAPATVNTGWQMLIAGLAFIPCAFVTGEWQHFYVKLVPVKAWLAVLYLVIMGSIAGFSAYIWLLKVRPATQVSTYGYVNPVIAIFLGAFFGHEHIGFLQIGGLAVILFSVLMINLHKYRAAKKAV